MLEVRIFPSLSLSTTDGIIGGPSGALLASRLALCKAAPSILLLEAGGDADDLMTRSLATRWISWATKPELNWGYNTVPQKYLKGRIIDQSRGKGLGGSTTINFCIWTTPPKGDLEEWAARLGDDFFEWKNSGVLINGIEAYDTKHLSISEAGASGLSKYVQVLNKTHGTAGKVTAEYSDLVDKGSAVILDAMTAYGWPAKSDLNSGDPIGHG